MRIIYDDAMQTTVVERIALTMIRLNSLMPAYVEYDYGMHRVKKTKLVDHINDMLMSINCSIGKTVTHPHGIGNNSQYPVYYRDGDDMFLCAYLNVNVDPFGIGYVCCSDYNGTRVSPLYKLTQQGVRIESNK